MTGLFIFKNQTVYLASKGEMSFSYFMQSLIHFGFAKISFLLLLYSLMPSFESQIMCDKKVTSFFLMGFSASFQGYYEYLDFSSSFSNRRGDLLSILQLLVDDENVGRKKKLFFFDFWVELEVLQRRVLVVFHRFHPLSRFRHQFTNH